MKTGRPIKMRRILKEPSVKQFSPRGRAGRPACVGLKFEELEAIRLTDHLDLKQADAAKFMAVSQQTFSRVLSKARKRLADALVTGKIIKVNGGSFKFEK